MPDIWAKCFLDCLNEVLRVQIYMKMHWRMQIRYIMHSQIRFHVWHFMHFFHNGFVSEKEIIFPVCDCELFHNFFMWFSSKIKRLTNWLPFQKRRKKIEIRQYPSSEITLKNPVNSSQIYEKKHRTFNNITNITCSLFTNKKKNVNLTKTTKITIVARSA